MKKLKLILQLTLVMLTFRSMQSIAQTDSCIIKLKAANTGYDQGDYDGTIKLLRSALSDCHLDKGDKIQAGKLLIMSYLKIDNLEEADKAAASVVKIDPYYKPDKFKDDPKLSALFEKYQPTEIFRLGFTAGINHTMPDVVKTYSIVHDDDADNLGEYSGGTGFQLGLLAEYRAYKNLWVEAGGLFRQSSYEHVLNEVEGTTINYSEKLSYVDVPVSVKYYFLKKNIQPYLEAGAAFSFLTTALGTTTRDDQKDIVNRTDYRNNFMVGYSGGLGVAYKIKGISVFAAFRYSYFGDNVNKDGTRYADLVNVFKYYYIDDDFRMDNWEINAGVNYSIAYKNKKVK
jgi:hypothetical protein